MYNKYLKHYYIQQLKEDNHQTELYIIKNLNDEYENIDLDYNIEKYNIIIFDFNKAISVYETKDEKNYKNVFNKIITNYIDKNYIINEYNNLKSINIVFINNFTRIYKIINIDNYKVKISYSTDNYKNQILYVNIVNNINYIIKNIKFFIHYFECDYIIFAFYKTLILYQYNKLNNIILDNLDYYINLINASDEYFIKIINAAHNNYVQYYNIESPFIQYYIENIHSLYLYNNLKFTSSINITYDQYNKIKNYINEIVNIIEKYVEIEKTDDNELFDKNDLQYLYLFKYIIINKSILFNDSKNNNAKYILSIYIDFNIKYLDKIKQYIKPNISKIYIEPDRRQRYINTQYIIDLIIILQILLNDINECLKSNTNKLNISLNLHYSKHDDIKVNVYSYLQEINNLLSTELNIIYFDYNGDYNFNKDEINLVLLQYDNDIKKKIVDMIKELSVNNLNFFVYLIIFMKIKEDDITNQYYSNNYNTLSLQKYYKLLIFYNRYLIDYYLQLSIKKLISVYTQDKCFSKNYNKIRDFIIEFNSNRPLENVIEKAEKSQLFSIELSRDQIEEYNNIINEKNNILGNIKNDFNIKGGSGQLHNDKLELLLFHIFKNIKIIEY